MKQSRLNRLLAIFVTLALVLQGIPSPIAFATQRTVELDNHTVQTSDATLVSGITIDGVDKPVAGTTLDNNAVVTTDSDAAWEIPVLWVRDDLQMDNDEADEGHTYLPVLAFFVPQGYALAEDVATVVLSDSLTELFGTHEIISVYNEATGITYIIPASLRGLFESAKIAEEPAQAESTVAPAQAQNTNAQNEVQFDLQDQPTTSKEAFGFGEGQSLVEMHCAQTARNVLSDEDLEWLVELIIDYLEPQAINYLLYNFPAFNDAAKNGEIGKEISLYVYYKTGDKDGIKEHEEADDALAYVTAFAKEIDGNLKYCYMLAINVDNLIKKDENGKPITNPKTGRYALVREGKVMEELHNAIVHELFHAVMNDYNRTGMSGATNIEGLRTDAEGNFLTDEAAKRYATLRFPSWFIEGTASSVEHVYAHRNYVFECLRRQQGTDGRFGTGELSPTYTTALLLDTYDRGHFSDGEFMYNDIGFCNGGTDNNGNKINTESSNYVTGYLATLYLCELTVRHVYNNESTVKVVDGVTTVDSDMLRAGLDYLLRWIHADNKSLDYLIKMLSPNDSNGQPLYKGVDSFQDLFIKGEANADGTFKGDNESLQFVTSVLNYLLYLDNKLPEGEHPTGSILEDFGKRYTTPLDQSKKTSSDYMKITNDNVAIPSTVKSDTTGIGGGKTDPDKTEVKTSAADERQLEQQETPLPEAAKTDAKNNAAPTEQSESTPEAEPEAQPTPVPEATATPEPESAPSGEFTPEQEPTSEPEAPAENVANPIQEDAEGTGSEQ